jgi:hypothetical protein
VHLSDVLELAVREGVRRRAEKRAGVLLPLAVGAMIPGIVHKAIERSRSTEDQMNRAVNQPFKTAALPLQLALPLAQLGQKFGPMLGGAGRAIGGAARSAGGSLAGGAKGSLGAIGGAAGGGVAQGISGGIGESIKRMMIGRDFGEKKDPLHLGGGAAISQFGKEMGTTGANLLRDIANKAMNAVGQAGDASAREAIIGDLKRNDPVLAGADDATLMEAYHTMSRFAPVLSTDKNAVRSFLRQAVTSGSGPDFMSIKLVADAERAVTGGGDKKASLDLHALLQAAAKPALGGAIAGGVTGAIADKDDRGGGALRGALTGGAMGGLGGALHGHMTGTPKDQGGLSPGVNWDQDGYAGTQGRSPNVMGVGYENRQQLWNPSMKPTYDRPHLGLRDLPAGVAEVAQELGHAPFGGPPVRS